MRNSEAREDASVGVDPEFILFATALVTIFWMVCGWRAMRAHEKLAEVAERAELNAQFASRGQLKNPSSD